jgi:hypothetical protein
MGVVMALFNFTKRVALTLAILTSLTCLSACAPQNQISVLQDNQPAIRANKQECETSTADEKSHTAFIACSFDGTQKILGDAGFKDWDLFYTFRNQSLGIAKDWDKKKYSDKKAEELERQASNNFHDAVSMRDYLRAKNYDRRMQAATAAMSRSVAQSNADYQPPFISTPAISPPSMPPAGATTNSLETWQSSVGQPSAPAPMGVGQGSRGYQGRIYIPAGPDPNPPPNILGQ